MSYKHPLRIKFLTAQNNFFSKKVGLLHLSIGIRVNNILKIEKMKYLTRHSKSIMTALFAVATLSACEKNLDDTNQTQVNPTNLVKSIQAQSKTTISKHQLPQKAQNQIAKEHTTQYIKSVSVAPTLGYEVTLAKKTTEKSNEKIYFNLQGDKLTSDSMSYDDMMDDNMDDIQFVLPVGMKMPDNSNLQILKEADWDKVEQWYEKNPDTMTYPTIAFPVRVKVNNQIKTINTQAELDKLFGSNGMYDGYDDYDSLPNIQYIYPLSYTMPNNTKITVANEKEFDKLYKWYEKYDLVFEMEEPVYPFQIKLANGTVQTINNLEERKKHEGDYQEASIQYPLTYTLPNKAEITINGRFQWKVLTDWIDNNPKTTEQIKLKFPIRIKLANGTIKTIQKETELFEQFNY